MSPYQAFEVAKTEILELQKNSGIEISNHLHQCVDHEILPQKKNYSQRGVRMRKISLFENHYCNYFS